MRIFAQTVVVGVGLIGGSVAKAARIASVGGKIVALNRREASSRRAVELDVVDAFATDWRDALRLDADHGRGGSEDGAGNVDKPTLVVFAAPVEANLRLLRDFLQVANEPEFANRRFLISDVGSVKTGFARAADALARDASANDANNKSDKDGKNDKSGKDGKSDRNDKDGKSDAGSKAARIVVVPAHPIAGSDKSGVEYATADLFRGKLTILTPWTTAEERLTDVAAGASAGVAALRAFWEALGARVVATSAEEHDRILARTSHLPNLVSVLTTSVVPLDEFPFAGTGFRDVTRLAGGNPDVWTEIFDSNRVATLEALERLEEKVVLWKSFLKNGDRDSILTFLQETKKKRDALGS